LDSPDAHRRAGPYQCVASSSACEKSTVVKEIRDRKTRNSPDWTQGMKLLSVQPGFRWFSVSGG
jgi:hypothetical protein